MAIDLGVRILPVNQRRTLEEITDDLDLTSGDKAAKRSAFWTMLVLSGVIAAAGVLTDSTATVIGAMIIAPLSTPIMGVALGIVLTDAAVVRRSVGFVVGGMAVVVAIGVAASLVVPGSVDLLTNPQIAGRVSPGLLDLVAAGATGLAGAVGLTRRDVSAILPGVAIAISLVPPLVVVGVCAGQGAWALAFGALVLFLSNFVALVLAGTLVYTAAGYARPVLRGGDLSRRKAMIGVGLLLVVVLVPLMANSVGSYLVTLWQSRAQSVAQAWVADVPGAHVQDVTFASNVLTIVVQTPDGEVPPVTGLLTALDGRLPNGIPVIVTTSVGQRIEAGTIGD
jgi:uncharacterized hydrophobic protein (TIGR00271 family)